MAKKSAVARDEKRKKMILKFAAKRAELKELGDLEGLQSFRLIVLQLAGRTATFFMDVHVDTCDASASTVLTSVKKQARAKSQA